jgi:hypothetical protein
LEVVGAAIFGGVVEVCEAFFAEDDGDDEHGSFLMVLLR